MGYGYYTAHGYEVSRPLSERFVVDKRYNKRYYHTLIIKHEIGVYKNKVNNKTKERKLSTSHYKLTTLIDYELGYIIITKLQWEYPAT